MIKFIDSIRASFIHRDKSLVYTPLLCGTWASGLVCGFCFSFHFSETFYSVMLSAVDSRLSIVGLFFLLTFPFLISAVLLRYTSPLALFPFVFIKAFSFGLCLCATAIAFGDAAWLVRLLLFFSDSVVTVFLLWFWLRNICGNRGALNADLLLCIVTSVLVGCIDFCFVSPFMVMIFDH